MQQITKKTNIKIFVISLLVVCFLLFQFIFLTILNNKQQSLSAELLSVTEQNKQLENDISYLSSDEAKKEYARQELGYVESGEEMFVGE